MTRRERFRGCFLAGAVGDALGAPVEFLSRGEILARYSDAGIREMDVAYGVRGAITDDTQMTLFTAEGLIRAHIRGALRGICNPAWIVGLAYRRWLVTQGESVASGTTGVSLEPVGWLYGVEELHRRRAPGTTCLSALRVSEGGTIARNDSKGCGAVMRVAPVGLFADDPYGLGCDTGLLTHGHPLGWTSAGVFAWLIARVVHGDSLGDAAARFSADPTALLEGAYSFLFEARPEVELGALMKLGEIVGRAGELARSDRAPHLAIANLGEGWVAEEALGIAVYCALRFADDLEGGIMAAVNHSGDSDSTGSMAGQLLGTALGEGAIPDRWLETLELREVVARVADDLLDVSHGRAIVTDDDGPDAAPGWWDRYPGC